MVEEVFIDNMDQAQALADSLWDEMECYRDHIIQIEMDLKALEKKWNVTSRLRRVYVRP